MSKKKTTKKHSTPKKSHQKPVNAVSLVKANYEALRKRYPELAERLLAVPLDAPESKYQVIRTNPQCYYPTLLLKEKNAVYYDGNNPLEDVRKNIDILMPNLKNTRIAFFCGFGLGYEVLYFLKEKAKELRTFAVMIVEKDIEIFKHAMHTVDLTSIFNNPRVSLAVGLSEEDLFVPFRNFMVEESKFMLMKACRSVFHQTPIHLFEEYYKKAFDLFFTAAHFQVANFGNDPYDSFIGIDNMLANLETILKNPGINLLFDKFKGKPAIIVATGPSLDTNKELLKGLEDKALMIGVDASMKILYPLGVKPHMYSSLERVMFVVDLFDKMPADAYEDSWLVACPVIRPEVYETYKGPTIIAYRNFDHFKWLPIQKGIIDSKFSAGNMAFKIAQVLGCNPIILVGQDLAFKKDLSQSHAKGSTLGDLQKDFFTDGMRTVKGNYEDELPTSTTFFNCIKGYEVDLQGWNGECINATEGGAYIHGTKVMTLQEAIDTYLQGPSFDSRQIIKNALQNFNTTTKFDKEKKMLKDLIDVTIDEFDQMRAEAQAAIDLIQANESWLQSVIDQIATLVEDPPNLLELEQQVTSAKYSWHKRFFNTYQLFFMHVFQSQHIKIEMDIVAIPSKYDDSNQAVAESLFYHKKWYEKFIELSELCVKRLEQSRIELS